MKSSSSLDHRRSFIIIAMATLVSFPLRVWPLAHLGLNQFDEGIYAMSARWVFAPHGIASLDASLIPYAPPGYPILVGLSFLFLGLSDQAALLVSATLGCLTVPVIAWISGRIFGVRAAVVSAWCICFSGPHIAFSRMALTDASFLFVWSLGFAASLWFLEIPQFRTGLVLGFMVGLAQQFKYNGWLLGGLVITTAILGPLWFREERSPSRWVRLGGWGGFAILIAWIVVYPWFHFVENHGGYQALLNHQKSYLGGWSAWWPRLISQINQAVVLAGPVWLSILTVLSICFSNWVGSPIRISGPSFSWTRVFASAGLLLGLLAAPVTTGLVTVPGLLLESTLKARFLGVSWVILIILSPYYHPYARLWLPFECLHWIILGGVSIRLIDQPFLYRMGGLPRTWNVSLVWPLVLIAAGFFVSGPGFPFAAPGKFGAKGLFDSSDSLHNVANIVVHRIPREVTSLRTLVRPALSFYLAGRTAQFPQSDLQSFGLNLDVNQWGLIDSTILSSALGGLDNSNHRSHLEPILDRWEVVQEIPAMTSLPTVLDLDPYYPRRPRSQSFAYFWLIRPRTPDASR